MGTVAVAWNKKTVEDVPVANRRVLVLPEETD